jgi:hypothetical protein
MLLRTYWRSKLIDQLEKYIDAENALNTNLILLVGTSKAKINVIFEEICSRHEVVPLNIGLLLSKQLNVFSQKQRCLMAGEVLRTLLAEQADSSLVFIKNIEVLFDSSLKLDPLDLLKRNAKNRKLIAVWPGQIVEERLVYADFGHGERKSYALDGIFTFEINS